MIEFFFDCSSPWTYLAFHNIQPLAKEFFAGISQQSVKDQLKANTDEVMALGGFGSPTIFLDKTDMYFGNDRLPLVREALARRKASAA